MSRRIDVVDIATPQSKEGRRLLAGRNRTLTAKVRGYKLSATFIRGQRAPEVASAALQLISTRNLRRGVIDCAVSLPRASSFEAPRALASRHRSRMALNLVSEQESAFASVGAPERDAIDRDADRASTPPAIEVRGIRKRYGDRDVLADVSLLVRPGCLHGLLGPERCGQDHADARHARVDPAGRGLGASARRARSRDDRSARRRCRRLRRDSQLLSISVRPPEPVAPRPSRRWPFVGPSGTGRTGARRRSA